MTEKIELAKQALKNMAEMEDALQMENLIKDNKVCFEHKKQEFRVRKLNFSEQQEIAEGKRKKYLELISDDSYLFRKQWIEKYKKKGIDINIMENKMQELEQQTKALLLRLARSKDRKTIDQLKEDILKLRDEQFKISVEKTDLLSYSIEDQIIIHTNSYTTYLVLEKLEIIDGKETWIKYFKTYKDFEISEDMALLNQAIYYSSYLTYGIEDESKNT